MNIEQMTEQLQNIIMLAVTSARERMNSEIAAEHILHAMAEDDALDGIWQRINVDRDELVKVTEDAVNRLPSVSGNSEPTVSRELSQGYTNALQYMKQNGDTYMSTAALLVGLFETNAGIVERLKKQFRIDAAMIRKAEEDRRGGMIMDEKTNESQLDALSKYGHDLVQDVRDGKIDPVIGRDDEIRRVIEILSRKTKNNPVLIGEPGVGKTAIVE